MFTNQNYGLHNTARHQNDAVGCLAVTGRYERELLRTAPGKRSLPRMSSFPDSSQPDCPSSPKLRYQPRPISIAIAKEFPVIWAALVLSRTSCL